MLDEITTEFPIKLQLNGFKIKLQQNDDGTITVNPFTRACIHPEGYTSCNWCGWEADSESHWEAECKRLQGDLDRFKLCVESTSAVKDLRAQLDTVTQRANKLDAENASLSKKLLEYWKMLNL